MDNNPARLASPVQRARLWYALLLVIFSIFVVRAFYLQVIKHDYYSKLAANSQLKEYVVQAPRGTIAAHLGDTTVPLVLNQKLFTLYADPTLVKKPDVVADKLQRVLGGSADNYEKMLKTKDTRYVVLKKKLTPDQSRKVLAYKFPGVGTQQLNYRTYPQGSMASQLLGFVNDDGQGTYGIEQTLNTLLAGQPGELKAVTDINGVPLAASSDNLSIAPVAGEDLTLTIDMGMQQQLEGILASRESSLKAKQLSAVVLDANTGAIKAMANVPTYDPSKYQDVNDPSVFQNSVVSNAIEPGSVMKPLTAAAAMDQGAVNANTTYYDPAQWVIDGFTIKNIEEDGGSGTQSIASILNLSLNTGATWMLMQMGGGQINLKGRTAWYNYLTDHYQFGKESNPELGYQADGLVPGPKDNGAGIDLTYANTTFGQAMTATALQMASGLASAVNGGTYYQPYVVEQKTGADGKPIVTPPKVVKSGVVSQATSDALIPMMEYTVKQHYLSGAPYLNFGDQYSVGGKTGTAQIIDPATGKYQDNIFNGTYIGFVGGDKPQYVIAVYAIEPHVQTYAGTAAGQPIFGDIAHMLINDFAVTPRS